MRDFTTTILTQPSNASANTTASEAATFTVSASTTPAGGSQTLCLGRLQNGSAITAGTNTGVTTAASLVINSAQQTSNASYKCTVSVTGGDDGCYQVTQH